MATETLAKDKEDVLKAVKRGKPPADCPVIGTWKLQSYVRERLSDGYRHNQFGEAPEGYIGYAPDGRMNGLAERLGANYPKLKVTVGSNDPAGYDIAVNATPLGMICLRVANIERRL